MGCLLKQGGGLYTRLRIGAVLLAAGEGRRMGGVAKPLIRLQGVPLIGRHLVALSGAGSTKSSSSPDTRARRSRRKCAVRRDPRAQRRVCRRPAWLRPSRARRAERQLRRGLRRPADQPLIGAADLTELIGAFKRRPAGHVVVPTVGAARQPDHPRRRGPVPDSRRRYQPRLPPPHRPQPELVHVHETENARFVTDLDTVEDVEELARRTGWKLELPALEAVR